jgi:acetyltransferase-like isoleucine patch superfamily enzyme
MVAARCQLVDSDHGFDARSEPMNRQAAHGGEIRVERNVWIGAGAIILKAVHIGEGAIVGAGSVVTRSIPGWEIWAGNPARRIGARP